MTNSKLLALAALSRLRTHLEKRCKRCGEQPWLMQMHAIDGTVQYTVSCLRCSTAVTSVTRPMAIAAWCCMNKSDE